MKYAHGAYVRPGVTEQDSMGVPLKFSGNSLAATCVEINQCVECTSFQDDDAAVLAPSSGEESTPPRSVAWRTTRRSSTNAP